MSQRISNLISLDLVKKLRNIKNISMKNYSYETQKIFIDEVNKDINNVNKYINNVNKDINNQSMIDLLFIHKYGLNIWLKT